MADWYVSSVAWTAISQFAASTVYTVGQIVRPLTTPAFTAQHAFRCTTAGTSSTEPSWPAANNGTVTTGGATFTNVSGQSAYGWSAAAGTLCTMTQISNSRSVAGDRLFLSSDHSESNNAGTTWIFNAATHAFGLVQVISVNRAGSTPPVAADIQNGASIATTAGGNLVLEAYCNVFWQGITISSNSDLRFNGSATKSHYFKNCSLVLSGSSTISRIGNSSAVKLILDNTTVQFGNASQSITPMSNGPLELLWMNTPSAVQGATIPTTLFNDLTSPPPLSVTCRGVDLSAITGTLCGVTTGFGMKGLFDSCRIASGATRLSTPVGGSNAGDEVELINCYDGTNVINERNTYAGAVTTDRGTYLSNGAQDDVGSYSLKLVSSSRADKQTLPLDCFAFDVENIVTGASKTATVEIISSASLNNDDISLLLEYMGTSGSPIASFLNTLPAVVTAGSALTASSNTWNSPPATPQKQVLQMTFVPQRAGRVRGTVRLGKASTTVWVNPQITIT